MGLNISRQRITGFIPDPSPQFLYACCLQLVGSRSAPDPTCWRNRWKIFRKFRWNIHEKLERYLAVTLKSWIPHTHPAYSSVLWQIDQNKYNKCNKHRSCSPHERGSYRSRNMMPTEQSFYARENHLVHYSAYMK